MVYSFLPIHSFFFFNWRKFALKCCDSFCCTTMQISHDYTYITSLLGLPPLTPAHSSRLSQSAWLGSLCYTATSHQVSILHMMVYIYQNDFLHSSRPLLPLLCPQVHVLHLCLHSFPANRFIITIFYRFHIYALIYNICFSLSD